MKKNIGALLWLLPLLLPAADAYRFQYTISGQAESRFLIIFPFRVYYEISGAVDLAAERLPEGGLRFSTVGMPRTAYLLRTLGYSGRTAILVFADTDIERGRRFAAGKEAEWRRQNPRFTRHVDGVRHVPRSVIGLNRGGLVFDRSPQGVIRLVSLSARTEPLSPRGWHGYYVNLFPLMAEALQFYGHATPLPAAEPSLPPAQYLGLSAPLDFSERLNRIGGLMEKVVLEMIKVRQEQPFYLEYRHRTAPGGEWLLEGEARPQVLLWKGFRIVHFRRSLRLRGRERLPQSDEIEIELRTDRGQGGYGKMELKRIAD